MRRVGRLCLQINASSRGIKNTAIDKRSSLHKARCFCFNFINLLFWDERLSVLHALLRNSVGALLRCHERALPRCDYWYFPLQSADGRRQPKHVSASCCVGGANGNSRQDTNNGGGLVYTGCGHRWSGALSPRRASSSFTLNCNLGTKKKL